jgi:hypothetical protein
LAQAFDEFGTMLRAELGDLAVGSKKQHKALLKVR